MNTLNTTETSRAATVFSVAVGASLPSVFVGRSVLAVVLLVAFFAYMLMRERGVAVQHLKALKGHPLTVLVVLVFVSWLPQLIESVDALKSLATVVRTGLIVVGATILWSGLYGNRRMLQCTLKAFLVTAFILSSLAIISLVAIPEVYSFIHAYGWVPANVPRGYKGEAATGALMAPLAIWAGWSLQGRWQWAGVLVASGFLIIVYLTQNRAGVAGLIGALVMGTIISRRLFKDRRSFAAVVMLVAGLAAAAFAWVVLSRIGGSLLPTDRIDLVSPNLIDWHRQAIWQYAWELGEGARWFGVGANIIDLLPNANVLVENTNTYAMPRHPHNWVVEILVETGFVGSATLLVAITFAFSWFVRRFQRHGELYILTAICIWGVYWASGLFNFSYWSAWWQASFFVATAVCLAAKVVPQNEETTRLP